jgi:prophage regulatory protein
MEKQNQPAEFPRQGFAREPQVLRVVPVGRSTLWSMAKEGKFPKPVKLSPRVTAWKCEDVWEWLEAQNAKQAA